jgi:hypothetical protein
MSFCFADHGVELDIAGDAEFGVRAVEVGSEATGAQREEQAVGDLAVGEAAAGECDDLALLRGKSGERVRRCGLGLCRDAAGAQFRFRAAGPRSGAQATQRLEGCRKDGFGVVDAPLPAKPLAVVQL